MVVAIDGPAGAGKSTIAKKIAQDLNLTFLNSGSFYRAITLSVLQNGIGITSGAGQVDGVANLASGASAPKIVDENAIIEHAKTLSIDYQKSHLILNGVDVEDLLHTDAVDSLVSQVSSIIQIRHIVNDKIRLLTNKLDIVCEGRDMTTVVFPDAEYKFYLDASLEAQAKRRFNQGVSNLTLEEIMATIKERDERDKKKAEGALKIASDACYVDTSDLTIEQVCAIIKGKIHI